MIMQNQNMVKKQNCVIWIHMDFLVYIRIDDIYKDIADDVKTKLDTWN